MTVGCNDMFEAPKIFLHRKYIAIIYIDSIVSKLMFLLENSRAAIEIALKTDFLLEPHTYDRPN